MKEHLASCAGYYTMPEQMENLCKKNTVIHVFYILYFNSLSHWIYCVYYFHFATFFATRFTSLFHHFNHSDGSLKMLWSLYCYYTTYGIVDYKKIKRGNLIIVVLCLSVGTRTILHYLSSYQTLPANNC